MRSARILSARRVGRLLVVVVARRRAARAGPGRSRAIVSPSTRTAARETRWSDAPSRRSRSSAAARSGVTRRRCTPLPSSSPAMLLEARHDVDPPAEVLGAARRGADPEVQRRALAEAAREPAQRVVQQRRAGRPVVLEAQRAGGAARASAGRAAIAAYGASSTASSSIATTRSRRRTSSATRSSSSCWPIVRVGVGAEALALARDQRRHEVEREQLRVGVRRARRRRPRPR